MRPHRRQPTRLPHPWDSPGKNTGLGCHFLLQCMKVKRESEVAQSCPTLRDPMDCSLQGSPVPGILQARTLEWVAISFSNAWKWKVKVKSLSTSLTKCKMLPHAPPKQLHCTGLGAGDTVGISRIGQHCNLLRKTVSKLLFCAPIWTSSSMLLLFINTSISGLVKSEGTIRNFMQGGKPHLDL